MGWDGMGWMGGGLCVGLSSHAAHLSLGAILTLLTGFARGAGVDVKVGHAQLTLRAAHCV